jgi:hypothetical protein
MSQIKDNIKADGEYITSLIKLQTEQPTSHYLAEAQTEVNNMDKTVSTVVADIPKLVNV